ncbi:MAG: phospholipase D-like domain-containing protein [Rhizobacter sp.]|nr:phospholipase D-like domain-containing protein [Rhizobacter sp.]
MSELLERLWALLPALLHVVAAVAVTIDAVLRKRQVSAVIGWIGLAWLAPVVGSVLYLLFGINRIQRSAVALGLREAWGLADRQLPAPRSDGEEGNWLARHDRFASLDCLSGRVTGNPLRAGNRIDALEDGDAAYPAMLAAIDGASRSVTLASYIFDNDATGQAFLAALQRAQQRGVQVRVLIDGLGLHYSRPDMLGQLRRAGLPSAAFLPTRIPLPSRYANLRNHRKIMVVDAQRGFTGGMNIRNGHWLAKNPAYPVRCLHFEVTGPIVADLQRTFAIDWAFASGEQLHGEPWFGPALAGGSVLARSIPDGPDADIDNTPQVILGALAVARSRVCIVTPYFLPDEVLVTTLRVTALRGVAVDIVLPARSNIRVMDWANRPQLAELLEAGCRVHLSPPPFDHTKLFLVDELWSLIGSTNWDTRSLRLNFECNLECYDAGLVRRLDTIAEKRIAAARRLVAAELRALPLALRLRNGLARLLSPYL